MFVQQIVPAVSLMKSHLRRIPFLIISIPMNAIGLCFDGLQGIIGMKRMAYLFVIPNLLLYIIFGVFPILLNFHYGFSGGTSVIPSERPFVGTRNFEVLLDCRDYLDANSCATDLFWRGVHNTVSYVFFEVSGIVLVSLMTAQVLNRKIRARGFFRGVFFYPVLLSSVVVALLWGWILQRTGLLNGLLIAAGLEPINFLFISAWAKFWTVFVGIWANLGFYTLIILAGLQAIPPTLYEAATIDGATNWDRFRYVTLPLLRPILFVVLLLSFVRSVQVFDHVYVLTEGGPGTATQYIMQYIYNVAFAENIRNFGLAASASMLVALILIALILIQRLVARLNARR